MKSFRFLLFLFALPLFNHAGTLGTLTNSDVKGMLNGGVTICEIEKKICGAPAVIFNLIPAYTDEILQLGGSVELIKLMATRNLGQPCPDNCGGPSCPTGQREALILPDATPIRLRLMRNLSSAYAKTGDRIYFEVLDDVKVSHYPYIVINREATAVGTIIAAQAKRPLDRRGRLVVRVDFVCLANGDRVALSGGDKDFARHGYVGAIAEGQEFLALTNGDARIPVP